jgi:hypothetical protein
VMNYVFRKNDISWLNMWMLLLHKNFIYVKTHEDGRNDDRKDGGGILRASTNTS